VSRDKKQEDIRHRENTTEYAFPKVSLAISLQTWPLCPLSYSFQVLSVLPRASTGSFLFSNERGFPTAPAAYPSSNPPDPDAVSCAGDIAHVRDTAIQPLVETEHRQVVILAHSYGGIVGAGAAKGFDVATRRTQGLTGGVIGLVYIAGNIAHANESLLEAVGGQYPPFIKRDTVRSDK
jgi:pimeloyl-ACP methyl ester carboxylesterase